MVERLRDVLPVGLPHPPLLFTVLDLRLQFTSRASVDISMVTFRIVQG